jgi:hypothetical protein
VRFENLCHGFLADTEFEFAAGDHSRDVPGAVAQVGVMLKESGEK